MNDSETQNWDHLIGPFDWVKNVPTGERHVYQGQRGRLEICVMNDMIVLRKQGVFNAKEGVMSSDWMGLTMTGMHLQYDPGYK